MRHDREDVFPSFVFPNLHQVQSMKAWVNKSDLIRDWALLELSLTHFIPLLTRISAMLWIKNEPNTYAETKSSIVLRELQTRLRGSILLMNQNTPGRLSVVLYSS